MSSRRVDHGERWSYWLWIPVGKLYTDRYVPLHPHLKTLLAQWLTHRGDTARSALMFL